MEGQELIGETCPFPEIRKGRKMWEKPEVITFVTEENLTQCSGKKNKRKEDGKKCFLRGTWVAQ